MAVSAERQDSTACPHTVDTTRDLIQNGPGSPGVTPESFQYQGELQGPGPQEIAGLNALLDGIGPQAPTRT
jgi:hypothetical protein